MIDDPYGWCAWLVYDWDMGYHVRAIFNSEIDALRYAVSEGYLKVKRVTVGEVNDQLAAE